MVAIAKRTKPKVDGFNFSFFFNKVTNNDIISDNN